MSSTLHKEVEQPMRRPRSPAGLDDLASQLEEFQASQARFRVLRSITCNGTTRHRTAATVNEAPKSRIQKLIVLDSSFNPPTLAHLRMVVSAVENELAGQLHPRLDELRVLLLLAINNADKAPKPAAFEQRLAMMGEFARDVHEALGTEQGPEQQQQQDAAATTSAETHPSPPAADRLAIDVGLTSEPFFHDKSAAIAASSFYEQQQAGSDGAPPEHVVLAGYDTLVRIFDPKYYPAPGGGGGAAPGETGMRAALGPFFESARLRVTMRTDAEWGGRDDQVGYVDGLLRGGELDRVGGRREWAGRIELVQEGQGGQGGQGGQREGIEVVSSTLVRAAVQREDWEKVGRLVSPWVRKWIQGAGLYRQ